VERVEAGAVIFREGPRGRVQSLKSGRPIPGFPGLTFTGTVMLDQVHYRYKVVERVAHPEPVVVALEGSRAVLEVEVLRSAARATLDGELLAKVRIQEISPGLYEVNAADVQAVLDNAGQVLTDLWPAVQPSLSLQTGLQYRITSAMSDGVLTGQGFTVTAPKLAERAGLQVGDTILSVNGQPVNGFASLYGIIREVRGNPALSTVQVELDRWGTRLTKIFRIR
jgi:membrane-associated protease RseP (regulator of RpoE activity)